MTNNVLNEATDQVKKLRRSRSDKMLAGVCGGVAKMIGVDAAILRIILVAATLLGFGTGAVLYAAAWILMPEEEPAM
ncbi:PspC domain-containing protein [Lentzea sp. NPDC059081]|uniref:PspC domain-containing protein n=1 Tax=Lentzea sp. NPDC059081 TaxID=3346719 RepID=UPI00368D07EF